MLGWTTLIGLRHFGAVEGVRLLETPRLGVLVFSNLGGIRGALKPGKVDSVTPKGAPSRACWRLARPFVALPEIV